MSSEEIGEIQALTGGKPLLSQETGMSRIGIEDTDAELAKIAAETAVAAPNPSITDPATDPQGDPTKAPNAPAQQSQSDTQKVPANDA